MSSYQSFPSPRRHHYSGLTPDMEDDDILGDKPARQVLMDNMLKQDQRKTTETKERLGSIQDRISRALSKYDLGSEDDQVLDDLKEQKRQSEAEFEIYIVGFNESADKKNKLLDSLYEFFVQYEDDEVSTSPGLYFDIDKSYSVASAALATANQSLKKLSNIHTTLVDNYTAKLKDKDSKKKGKKLEQSFRDAQNELVTLKDTLETTTRGLNEANTKADGLRKSLDLRTSEVEKNKQIIERLKKLAENSLGPDERKLFKERADILAIFEKEITELKLDLAQLEFNNRKGLSESVKNMNDSSAAADIVTELQQKMLEERDKHAETIRLTRAGIEIEIDDAVEKKEEEMNGVIEELKIKVNNQQTMIEDLQVKLEEATRIKTPISPIVSPTPELVEEEVVVEVEIDDVSDKTNSEVSVDPTEALKTKYKELEEEFDRRRQAVEEEMARNVRTNKGRLDELNNELQSARLAWEQEKAQLEGRVEEFRKMVAEMEAESQERAHALAEKLKGEDDLSSLDSSDLNEMQASITIRPTTAVRNTFTPGPENPVVEQVITMYDHVTDFKNKITKILAEIQGMGIIDETETMLMKRSMEQITTLEFSLDGDVHQQIEDIQNNIAQVMHSSEKAVHKIFKKLSKERTKVESLSWVSDLGGTRPRSVRSSSKVEVCDRASSPILSHPPPTRQCLGDRKQQQRRPPPTYTAMFAHQDVEHNRRSLKLAVQNHKITPKQYEEVLAMMQDYSNIPTKRLAHLAKHYISHARMQLMEENISMNRPVCDDIDDVIGRLDELYTLRKTRYGNEMDKLSEEREDLAYLLTKQLDRLENQSGIFLIKPYIAYKSNTMTHHSKKEPVFVPPPPQVPVNEPMSSEMPDRRGTSSWSVHTSRATSAYDWSPNIPRLLEMDINRVTVARNVVTQPTNGGVKTMKSFVIVRTSKSRPRSNATSAEFLSIESFASDKSDDITNIPSDTLPPLRTACSSGFVSASTSRQRLAPIQSPPSTITVEKAVTS